MQNQINRRAFDRFALSPMYTRVTMRFMDQDSFDYEGHCYDISEAGLQFELDRPVEPGTTIVLRIDLPLDANGEPPAGGQGRHVDVFSKVVWLDEDDMLVGPVRMAASFSRFARFGDKDRLISSFCSGRFMRAA